MTRAARPSWARQCCPARVRRGRTPTSPGRSHLVDTQKQVSLLASCPIRRGAKKSLRPEAPTPEKGTVSTTGPRLSVTAKTMRPRKRPRTQGCLRTVSHNDTTREGVFIDYGDEKGKTRVSTSALASDTRARKTHRSRWLPCSSRRARCRVDSLSC